MPHCSGRRAPCIKILDCRGAALADGKVVNGWIQCPYHGWSFDGAGHCRWSPSLGRDAQLPAHTEFVHAAMGYQGADGGYRVPEFTIDRKDWGAGAMIEFAPPPPKGLWRMLRKPGTTVVSGAGFHGPSHVWTYVHITARAWSHQYIYHTPVDEFTDRVFFVNARNVLTSRFFKKGADRRSLAIIEQDRRIIERLEPIFTSDSPMDPLSVRADALSLHYWWSRGIVSRQIFSRARLPFSLSRRR
jgi:phenylpropionate dioxygenase-like ring-hydroxylating dioxygenase large terminal subunit